MLHTKSPFSDEILHHIVTAVQAFEQNWLFTQIEAGKHLSFLIFKTIAFITTYNDYYFTNSNFYVFLSTGVHRRMFPGLQSLRQPGFIKSLEVGKKRYLFTADEGSVTSLTNARHGKVWTDMTVARTIGTPCHFPYCILALLSHQALDFSSAKGLASRTIVTPCHFPHWGLVVLTQSVTRL